MHSPNWCWACIAATVLTIRSQVLVALNRGDLAFEESYVFIAETDHLIMKPIPNLATRHLAVSHPFNYFVPCLPHTQTHAHAPAQVGYPFHYMVPTRNSKTVAIVRRFAGSDATAAAVQQVGPSPVLMHMDALRALVKPWYDLSFALKKDPAADAEFGWMLEMCAPTSPLALARSRTHARAAVPAHTAAWPGLRWGYSIGAAVGGVKHKLLDAFQLEPSSQFGTTTTDGHGAYTHYILHYTFAHEYSLEGIPMIDSRAGAWAFDKRQYQAWLPRQLSPPPHCVLESTHTLWSLLHDAMAAHDARNCTGCTGHGQPWPEGAPELLRLSAHDKWVRSRIDHAFADSAASRAGESSDSGKGSDSNTASFPSASPRAALALMGTGPWTFRDADQGSDAVGPFFFLRGGQLHTPWGSAAWALARGAAADGTSDPIVVFLCGRERWTHSLRIELSAGGSTAAAGDSSNGGWVWELGARLVLTARSTGEEQIGELLARPAALSTSSMAELRAAFLATEDLSPGEREAFLPSALNRRLLGTGPWTFGWGHGTIYLLAHGVAYFCAQPRQSSAGALGWWRAAPDGHVVVGGASHGTQTGSFFGGSDSPTERWLRVDCWTLTSNATSPATSASLVWSHPASRCFPTCSDATHSVTSAEFQASELARKASELTWSWANIPGMRFTFSDTEGGVLITPWGHGEWGITPSRKDVLVAEFAQQRHMLKFDTAVRTFVSTRCADGEVVQGRVA